MGLTTEEWNSKYPVGTWVRYYLFAGERYHIESRTRSNAWYVYGEPVVLIEGRSGGVPLDRVEVIDLKDINNQIEKRRTYGR